MREPFVGPLPRIRGTQVGLENPQQIDQIKCDMLEGRFDYVGATGIVYGVIDSRGVYYVKNGHHRMVAAFEIFSETGDDHYLRMLLSNGKWETVNWIPNDSAPMPGRTWWRRFWNRHGF